MLTDIAGTAQIFHVTKILSTPNPKYIVWEANLLPKYVFDLHVLYTARFIFDKTQPPWKVSADA